MTQRGGTKGRSALDWVGIFLRGMAMGTADLVPGVSGGTIAFLTGIYEELLASLAGLRWSLVGVARRDGIAAAWKAGNFNFLLALVAGMASAVVGFSGLLHFLLEQHPVLLWSFFFGLVAASVPTMLRGTTMNGTSMRHAAGAVVVGAFIAWTVTGLPELIADPGLMELVLAGALGICAMLLPGISGSFVLVILGAYPVVIKAVAELDFLRLGAVGVGMLAGLLLFSRGLDRLFRRHRDVAVALLSGFLLGSLRKLWPWEGAPVGDIWPAAICALAGAGIMLLLSRVSRA